MIRYGYCVLAVYVACSHLLKWLKWHQTFAVAAKAHLKLEGTAVVFFSSETVYALLFYGLIIGGWW